MDQSLTEPVLKALPKELRSVSRSRTVKLGSYVDEKGRPHEKEAMIVDFQFDGELADAVSAELPPNATQADMPEAIRRAVAKMEAKSTGSPSSEHEPGAAASGTPAPAVPLEEQEEYQRWVIASLRDHYGLGVQLGAMGITELVDLLAVCGISVGYLDWLAVRFPKA